MLNTYTFVDRNAFTNPSQYGGTFLYNVRAHSEEEVWERFARFAKGNFGLKSDDVDYVRDYFGDTVQLCKPDQMLTL